MQVVIRMAADQRGQVGIVILNLPRGQAVVIIAWTGFGAQLQHPERLHVRQFWIQKPRCAHEISAQTTLEVTLSPLGTSLYPTCSCFWTSVHQHEVLVSPAPAQSNNDIVFIRHPHRSHTTLAHLQSFGFDSHRGMFCSWRACAKPRVSPSC